MTPTVQQQLADIAGQKLLPGMMFLRHIEGWHGRAISAMQGFVRGGSFWTHAGLIVDGGWYIQGQPGGAKLYPVGNLFDGRPLLVSDAPIQIGLAAAKQLTNLHDTTACPACASYELELRAELAHQGRLLEHKKYSFLDYPALGLAEFARKHPNDVRLTKLSNDLRAYINSGSHLICSALVDRAALNTGIHLFTDKRMAGDVTPEDLAWLAYADGRKPLIDTRENAPQEAAA